MYWSRKFKLTNCRDCDYIGIRRNNKKTCRKICMRRWNTKTIKSIRSKEGGISK